MVRGGLDSSGRNQSFREGIRSQSQSEPGMKPDSIEEDSLQVLNDHFLPGHIRSQMDF